MYLSISYLIPFTSRTKCNSFSHFSFVPGTWSSISSTTRAHRTSIAFRCIFKFRINKRRSTRSPVQQNERKIIQKVFRLTQQTFPNDRKNKRQTSSVTPANGLHLFPPWITLELWEKKGIRNKSVYSVCPAPSWLNNHREYFQNINLYGTTAEQWAAEKWRHRRLHKH